ncbi:tRNA pseudouridine(55) synthase TruB [uncultured Schumannella sp.]|uniref:tRNA pseudouridine(55) synthase TruB n=1 Tax=uncultured Schumannella sp. TaxID=1195956 RepID=UPI0025E5FCA8|nr:tRNA pseudouridine(55) synthase TruB [uncultured Schumannella sp.]
MSASPGVLLVDKPQGITSHDVVSRARRALDTRKVGHAGTLDPMATGLLLLGANSATRLLTYLVGLDKDYAATIRLGQSTSTDDAEGDVTGGSDARGIDRAAIDAVIQTLTGDITQVPSTVSAIKVQGRRAYELARAGETVELRGRDVTVSSFVVDAERRGDDLPEGTIDLDVRVSVSSGTYVRALARDLGAALGVGGHLTALRRTRIGPFSVDDAIRLDPEHPERARAALLEPAAVATALYPSAALDAAQLRDLAHGKRITVDHPDAEVLALLGPDGRLAGLAAVTDRAARILVNFPTQEVLS